MKAHYFILFIIITMTSSISTAHETVVEPLLKKTIPNLENQETLMLTVTLPPGEKPGKHRHNAHTFVYVLQGSVIMQVQGGERTTLKAGDTFYETPDDVHTVSMNASDTEEAKFLVFLIKEVGAAVTVPVQ